MEIAKSLWLVFMFSGLATLRLMPCRTFRISWRCFSVRHCKKGPTNLFLPANPLLSQGGFTTTLSGFQCERNFDQGVLAAISLDVRLVLLSTQTDRNIAIFSRLLL